MGLRLQGLNIFYINSCFIIWNWTFVCVCVIKTFPISITSYGERSKKRHHQRSGCRRTLPGVSTNHQIHEPPGSQVRHITTSCSHRGETNSKTIPLVMGMKPIFQGNSLSFVLKICFKKTAASKRLWNAQFRGDFNAGLHWIPHVENLDPPLVCNVMVDSSSKCIGEAAVWKLAHPLYLKKHYHNQTYISFKMGIWWIWFHAGPISVCESRKTWQHVFVE